MAKQRNNRQRQDDGCREIVVDEAEREDDEKDDGVREGDPRRFRTDCPRRERAGVSTARVGKSRVREPREQDAVGCRFAQDSDDGCAKILIRAGCE